MFTYTSADHEEVGKMMKAIVDALKPFRARKVPAILAAMALMRCLRAVLVKMPRRFADPFADACVAMLKGESPDQLVVPFNSSRWLQ
jgi:hypothetical protein